MASGWELPYDVEIVWEVAKAQEPPRKRVTRGLRLASTRAAGPAAEAESSAMDGDWGAAVADGDASDGGAAAAAGGADGSSYGFERLPGAQAPWQRAEATLRQQKWDGVRSSLHRGYVEQQPAIHALRREAIAAHRQSLQQCLAAVQPCCSCCGGTNLQPAEPVEVLYIGIERRFLFSVPDDDGLELNSSLVSSCHRLRQALRDFPPLLPLVCYSSAKSGIPSNKARLIIAYFADCPAAMLEACSEALARVASSLAGGSALNAPAERPSARPALDPEAVAFAARAAELTAQHAVAPSGPASQPPAAIPEGAELRGARLVVSAAIVSPSHSLLAAVTAHNKRSTAGATLQPEWSLTREGETATVNVAALWAAMCAAGGIMQARKRGGPAVLRAVRSIPGQEGFPESLVKALLDRIDSWLLPMYVPREDELTAIEPDQLRAVLQRGIAEGALLGPAEAVAVCSPAPDRTLLLAAMQARSIHLPNYDVVVARGQAHDVPLEAFWAHLSSVGGVQQVLNDKSALKCVAAASGLNEAAITAAATLLLPLAASTASESAALPAELQALLDAPWEMQLPTLPLPGGLELELPLPAEQLGQLGGTTPGAPLNGSTPFDTSLAADQLANLSQLTPPPFSWAALASQVAQHNTMQGEHPDTTQPDATQQCQPGGNEQHGSAHKRQRNA